MFYSTKRRQSYLDKGYRFDHCCSGYAGESLPLRTTYFPPTERGLHLSVHQRLYRIEELRGRLSDLTIEGVDTDALKARIYHIRDSPWDTVRSWCCPQSPDLDAEERSEMDADSWGVPDRRTSEATEDDIEDRWHLNFGGEDEAAE